MEDISKKKHSDDLMEQVQALHEIIQGTRKDLSSLRQEQEKNINDMHDELDAVSISIQTATNKILDETEHLEKLQAHVAQEGAEQYMNHITNIYEACTFQDMTGQRLSKVIKALKDVESRLKAFFEGKKSNPMQAKTADEELLNGPQLPGNAANQSDIDKLFN